MAVVMFIEHIKALIFHTFGTGMKLDMSTAGRRLKLPRSLSGTSAHPTMVTLVNIMVMNGWLKSFHSMSFGPPPPPPFLRYSYFRLWPWNSKVKVMGVVKGQYQTVSYQLTIFSFHINQTNNSWDTAFSKFDLETSKVKVMSDVKVKVTYYTQYQSDTLPFHYTSVRPTIPEIWAK